MYNITAYLTIKNKTFYTVLTYYVDGERKLKWVSTGIKEHESKKKGISLREIQDWLGHSSSKTTERYAHLDSSTKIKSATAIENALSFNGNKKDILDLDSNTSNQINISNCQKFARKFYQFLL